MKDKLIEKKITYLNMIDNIKNEDYSEEIEKKVQDFKQSLIDAKEAEKNNKINKLNIYLELLDELLLTAENEDKISDEADNNDLTSEDLSEEEINEEV